MKGIVVAIAVIEEEKESLRELFNENAYEECLEYEDGHECYSPYKRFPLVYDTRKPSQFINNKPRYMVRKIFG
jgi:hypothetical protein